MHAKVAGVAIAEKDRLYTGINSERPRLGQTIWQEQGQTIWQEHNSRNRAGYEIVSTYKIDVRVKAGK